ncbi:uncharacterized protein UBRO_20445 [Ustilago bromivora]|uniref:Galactose oxidase n=1 Tax=Ustilago bromivora TaxID=307758 RepID=A0A1K0GX37_9BASI|nr:uncharacterized protein UBRO_20445 [Ustilago bromivora]SYW75262.1 uncharacterized protein UBRO2_00497 [Ustilago bromivora]
MAGKARARPFSPNSHECHVEKTLASSSRTTLCSLPQQTATQTTNSIFPSITDRSSSNPREQQHASSSSFRSTATGTNVLTGRKTIASGNKSNVDAALASRGSPSSPGYLDRSRASGFKGKRRDVDAQSIGGKSYQRGDEVFPAVVAINSTSNSTPDSTTATTVVQGDIGHTLTIIFEQPNGTENNVTVTPPTRRWGQTATFLPKHNVVLVVGVQTSLWGEITNDVYALDVSDLYTAELSNATTQTWQRLSSEGLPAHAFAAASTLADPVDGTEKLWIVGGVTQNCAQDAPAYVWSAPAGDITVGSWSAVYANNGVSPSRRRGAKAITVASANSTTVMVSGGSYDATTCATSNGTYMGVDMWTQTLSTSSSSSSTASASSSGSSSSLIANAPESAHFGIDYTTSAYATVSSVALDPLMTDFSLVDYTTVRLPATTTCGEKIHFLGGKDNTGSMGPLDRFWALDIPTGNWERWNATGLIPAGRIGHTAVATPDGKVIIHGGYLEDPNTSTGDNEPLSEVFILDSTQTPARWAAAVWTSGSARPPATFASAGAEGENSQVRYMDTTMMGSAGGMTWSTTPAGVKEARAVVANVAAAAASVVPAPVPAEAPVAPVIAAPVEAAPATPAPVKVAPEATAPAPVSASNEPLPAPGPDASDNSTAPPPSSTSHTSAIAGSLLGAAAIAAAIGGIYAYRKRKEAAAYKSGRQDATSFPLTNPDPFLSDEEKRGPYVSNLYLQEMCSFPPSTAAAAGAGWSAKLKRAAGSLTKSNSGAATLGGADHFTTAPKPVVTMRNTAPRSAEEKEELPEEFIVSLADDDSPFIHSGALGRGELLHPTAHNEMKLLHLNGSRASLATVSTLDASHFSYPYLSGMHRTSPNSQHSKVRVILGTPNSGMSPGDIFSPFHLPHQPHASPESLFLDQLEDDLDTTIAFDGVSRVGAQSPIFPWSTPTIAAPPPAKIRTESMTRAERGSLRVTNAF